MSPNAANNLIAGSAAIQAVSALAVAFLTAYLVRATNKYVRTTEKVLELDWSPDVRIAQLYVTENGGDVFLTLVNLAKPAALVKEFKLGVGGRAKTNHPPQDVETYPLLRLLTGGDAQNCDVQEQLMSYMRKRNPTASQIGMSISIVYDCSGRKNDSQWVDCDVQFAPHRVTGARLL